MVPAFDAGLTRSRAARPHRSGMVIDSPHGCLGVCGRTIHRLAGVRPIALRQSWAILLKNRTHAMLLVRPSRTLERRPKNGRCVDSGGRAVSDGMNWQASAGPYRAGREGKF